MKATPYSDQKNWSNTYLTDPTLIKLLGPFGTDPCCPPKMPWRTAKLMFTHMKPRTIFKEGPGSGRGRLIQGDGLTVPWRGRLFMNPPYRGVLAWAKKFAEHGHGIALLNGRATETKATQLIMESCVVIWFPSPRLTFYKVTGKPFAQRWFPSLLIGMSFEDARYIGRAQKEYGGQIFIRERT